MADIIGDIKRRNGIICEINKKYEDEIEIAYTSGGDGLTIKSLVPYKSSDLYLCFMVWPDDKDPYKWSKKVCFYKKEEEAKIGFDYRKDLGIWLVTNNGEQIDVEDIKDYYLKISIGIMRGIEADLFRRFPEIEKLLEKIKR